MIIYKITNNINNKVYIGQTITSLSTRWRDHRRLKNRRFSHLKNSINVHGRENFIIEQIDTAETITELNEKEVYWIKFYNSTDRNVGYNLMSGGGSKGSHSLETIQKMRDVKLGKPRKPHSEETKKLFSEMRKGKPSPHKGKKGKPHTLEQRQAKSIASKGRPAHNKGKSKLGEMIGIRKVKNRYKVTIFRIYVGMTKTLEEAKQMRDNYLDEVKKRV